MGEVVFQPADISIDMAEDSTDDVVYEDVDTEQDVVEPVEVEVFDTMDMVEVKDHVELPDVYPDGVEELDIPDVKPDETVVNPCDEDEYPDPILKKCLNYPCCDLGGAWILEFTDATDFPWKVYFYSLKIEQDKAYLELEFYSVGGEDSPILPSLLLGTLEKEVFHAEGGGVADEGGYLVLDADKLEFSLQKDGEIFGTYKWMKYGEATVSGPFTLEQN